MGIHYPERDIERVFWKAKNTQIEESDRIGNLKLVGVMMMNCFFFLIIHHQAQSESDH